MSTIDYFSLLGLPTHYEIERAALDKAYFDRQRALHPDRQPTEGSNKLQAAQDAALLNDAYQTLKHPRRRAEYLLSRQGIFVNSAQDNVKPAQDLLLEMMERQETLAEMTQADAIRDHEKSLKQEIESSEKTLGPLFERNEWDIAAQMTLRLRYLEKLYEDMRLKLRSLSAH